MTAPEKETSYEMDGVGNITERVDREKDVTRTADFQVNSRNQVTSYKGQALSYDLNGNLTQYVDRYVYNWKNQLVRVEKASGGEVYFKYDALGRRVEKSTTAGFVKRYVCADRAWIQMKKAQGYEIYDIGPDFVRRSERVRGGIRSDSPFYNMERMETSRYERYIKLFERKGKYKGGTPLID